VYSEAARAAARQLLALAGLLAAVGQAQLLQQRVASQLLLLSRCGHLLPACLRPLCFMPHIFSLWAAVSADWSVQSQHASDALPWSPSCTF
jgi:hypothetical protein